MIKNQFVVVFIINNLKFSQKIRFSVFTHVYIDFRSKVIFNYVNQTNYLKFQQDYFKTFNCVMLFISGHVR